MKNKRMRNAEVTEYVEDLETLGKRIRQVRLELNFTQEDFARSLGIANTYLSEIEAGRRNPRLAFFFKLLYDYHISLDFLFLGSGPIFLHKTRFGEKDPVLIDDVHDIDSMVLLMEASSVYRDNVMGFAGRFFLDNVENIRKNIENLRRDKEEKDNDTITRLSTKPPRKK